MKFRILNKADILLYVFFVIILIIGMLLLHFSSNQGGNVVVLVDGEIYGTYSLEENTVIEISNGANLNTIVIADGEVKMQSANCNNQHCIHQGTINETSHTIICLPNRVSVEIVSDDDGAYDAVVN